ncbi:hypothetical protein J6590_051445 [Homalodisca vitripennis]|nr:hypothetical protein J6590_051445 [Homalodisca vitripennis]
MPEMMSVSHSKISGNSTLKKRRAYGGDAEGCCELTRPGTEGGEGDRSTQGAKFSRNRTPPIIVKFTTRQDRDDWLQAFKEVRPITVDKINRHFNKDKIFIYEHLSPENKQLLGRVKEAARTKGHKRLFQLTEENIAGQWKLINSFTDKKDQLAIAQIRDEQRSGHSVFKYDVTNFQSADELLKAIIQKYNRPPNILVNSAGILAASSTLDMTPEFLQRMLDVNLKGTFFTSQAVCRELSAAKLPGAIVNFSSVAVRNNAPGMAAYTASKAGVDAITKCMAKDMSQYNIRVNSVQPGWIDTPLTAALAAQSDRKEAWTNRLATKRIGQPQEVAELIVFLSSDRASYINGSNISIDGGF